MLNALEKGKNRNETNEKVFSQSTYIALLNTGTFTVLKIFKACADSVIYNEISRESVLFLFFIYFYFGEFFKFLNEPTVSGNS